MNKPKQVVLEWETGEWEGTNEPFAYLISRNVKTGRVWEGQDYINTDKTLPDVIQRRAAEAWFVAQYAKHGIAVVGE